MHHGSGTNERIKSDSAHQRVQKLQYQSQVKRLRKQPSSIANIPLVSTPHGLMHDPDILPMFPPCLEDHWTSGPLGGKPHPSWSKFHVLSFEHAHELMRQAGPCGGIYQIWVSRKEMLPDGNYKVMRTEVYIGSAVGEHDCNSL